MDAEHPSYSSWLRVDEIELSESHRSLNLRLDVKQVVARFVTEHRLLRHEREYAASRCDGDSRFARIPAYRMRSRLPRWYQPRSSGSTRGGPTRDQVLPAGAGAEPEPEPEPERERAVEAHALGDAPAAGPLGGPPLYNTTACRTGLRRTGRRK